MLNYDRIRVLICDHLNLARGKYIPFQTDSGQIELCQGVYAVGYHRDVIPAPGGGMLQGFPDMKAVYNKANLRPSWEDNVAVTVADLYSNDEPLTLCPRQTLKRSIEKWQALGYQANIGIELEAYLFQKNDQNHWVPYEVPGAYVYGTGNTADPNAVIENIWQQAQQSNFELTAIHSEFDPAQFEFTLKHKDALSAIDEAFLFRLMAMEVSTKAGYKLSFMPKPLNDRSGSGFHINFSFLDKEGKNALADQSKEDGISHLAKQCIAGLLHHHQSLAGIQAPTVNSYRRLRPGNLSGFWANWGYDHRGTAVRIPKARGEETRLEHRLADAAANPYIATTASLEAALLGHHNHYNLIDAETQDCNEFSDCETTAADNLAESLTALARDSALSNAIGQDIIKHHLSIKQDEWQRYSSHTSDWELEEYFQFL